MAKPSHVGEPKSGDFPLVTYQYEEGSGFHFVSCECGAQIVTTEAIVARRFIQTEAGKHARNRVFDPEPPAEP